MLLSVVARMYGSGATLRQFHQQVRREARAIAPDLEIILVNDDSPDDSLDVARALVAEDSSVRVIDLSRTFGNDKALLTGLANATGDLIFTADGNVPASAQRLPEYYRQMQSTGVDSVHGLDSDGEIRIMSRAFLENLLRHRDREVYLAGLYELTGYRQLPVTAPKARDCLRGRLSKWIAGYRARAAFSTWPLVLVFYLGTVVLACALCAALYLFVDRVFFRTLLPGWPSLVVSIWLLGGLVLFCLGVIALYLSKIFLEVKDRPDTIVREVLRPGVRGG
jgi:putative glycosyltransferase